MTGHKVFHEMKGSRKSDREFRCQTFGQNDGQSMADKGEVHFLAFYAKKVGKTAKCLDVALQSYEQALAVKALRCDEAQAEPAALPVELFEVLVKEAFSGAGLKANIGIPQKAHEVVTVRPHSSILEVNPVDLSAGDHQVSRMIIAVAEDPFKPADFL